MSRLRQPAGDADAVARKLKMRSTKSSFRVSVKFKAKAARKSRNSKNMRLAKFGCFFCVSVHVKHRPLKLRVDLELKGRA